FAFSCKHVATSASTVESSKCIEHVNDAECQRTCYKKKYQRTNVVTFFSKVSREVETFCEYLYQSLVSPFTESTQGVSDRNSQCIVHICCKTKKVVENCRTDDTVEDSTLDLLLRHDSNCNKTDDCYNQRHYFAPRLVQEVHATHCNTCRGVSNYQ